MRIHIFYLEKARLTAFPRLSPTQVGINLGRMDAPGPASASPTQVGINLRKSIQKNLLSSLPHPGGD